MFVYYAVFSYTAISMISTNLFSIVLLAASTYASWVTPITNEEAWQTACGHSRRVGSVCLSAQFGEPSLYGVQSNAKQNVVFSGQGNYFNAYCPVLDKGEQPYAIHYGLTNDAVFYRILGRHSTERCCQTQYIDIDRNPSAIQCLEPAMIWSAKFPPQHLEIKS